MKPSNSSASGRLDRMLTSFVALVLASLITLPLAVVVFRFCLVPIKMYLDQMITLNGRPFAAGILLGVIASLVLLLYCKKPAFLAGLSVLIMVLWLFAGSDSLASVLLGGGCICCLVGFISLLVSWFNRFVSVSTQNAMQ